LGWRFDALSKALAVLIAEEGPSHVDRVARAPSKDLALTYVQEALRDVHSLTSLGREAFKVKPAHDLLKSIDWKALDRDLLELSSREGFRELREALALITARAIAISAQLMRGGDEGEEKGEEEKNVSSDSGEA